MGGGGVDGAILRAGGPAQLPPAAQLVERIGSLPTGRGGVRPTPATMPARWVIHVVGPVHSPRRGPHPPARVVLPQRAAVADELGAALDRLPRGVGGIYGWPIDDAADVAVRTVASTPTGSPTSASCCSATTSWRSSHGLAPPWRDGVLLGGDGVAGAAVGPRCHRQQHVDDREDDRHPALLALGDRDEQRARRPRRRGRTAPGGPSADRRHDARR